MKYNTSAYTIISEGDLVGLAYPGSLLYSNKPDQVGVVVRKLYNEKDELNDEWYILINGEIQIIRKWRIQEILS